MTTIAALLGQLEGSLAECFRLNPVSSVRKQELVLFWCRFALDAMY